MCLNITFSYSSMFWAGCLINFTLPLVQIRVGISLIFFLFLHENIYCDYSLEAPRRGASNEYHNICFRGEIRKISILLD